ALCTFSSVLQSHGSIDPQARADWRQSGRLRRAGERRCRADRTAGPPWMWARGHNGDIKRAANGYVRFIDIGRTGHSDKATRARPMCRVGDEEDRAREGESLTSAPALRERCHGSLARRLILASLQVTRSLDRVDVVDAAAVPL